MERRSFLKLLGGVVAAIATGAKAEVETVDSLGQRGFIKQRFLPGKVIVFGTDENGNDISEELEIDDRFKEIGGKIKDMREHAAKARYASGFEQQWLDTEKRFQGKI